VQERLFPQQIPAVKGLSLAEACRPAQGVGSDYYDVFELHDGRLALAIGDVSGTGISAALLMASLRASLRGMTDIRGAGRFSKNNAEGEPVGVRGFSDQSLRTFSFATYNSKAGELRYVNAGHNAPILVRGAADDALHVRRLEAGGLVVGLMRDVHYAEESVTLESGDLLLTFTDGISEAMTARDEEWGEERMLDAAGKVRNGTAAEILPQSLMQRINSPPEHRNTTT
jgi:phosphoserine phosphatase RsbU/P